MAMIGVTHIFATEEEASRNQASNEFLGESGLALITNGSLIVVGRKWFRKKLMATFLVGDHVDSAVVLEKLKAVVHKDTTVFGASFAKRDAAQKASSSTFLEHNEQESAFTKRNKLSVLEYATQIPLPPSPVPVPESSQDLSSSTIFLAAQIPLPESPNTMPNVTTHSSPGPAWRGSVQGSPFSDVDSVFPPSIASSFSSVSNCQEGDYKANPNTLKRKIPISPDQNNLVKKSFELELLSFKRAELGYKKERSRAEFFNQLLGKGMEVSVALDYANRFFSSG